MSTNASSGDPQQLVLFAANKKNLMYIVDFIYAHCNQNVVDCFSSVTHVHLISSNFEFQTFKHLTWPIVSINFNITMLHFVLYHNVTCYINSLLSHIHVRTPKNHMHFDCHMCDAIEFRVYMDYGFSMENWDKTKAATFIVHP